MLDALNGGSSGSISSEGRTAAAPGGFGLQQVFPRGTAGVCPSWHVTGSVTVGREPSLIKLNHPSVAAVHARLEGERDGLYVCGVAGAETHLNGNAVDEHRVTVKAGSVLRFGDVICIAGPESAHQATLLRSVAGAQLGLSGEFWAGSRLAGVWDRAEQVARLTKSVLVEGETGTGKEIVARLIHRARDSAAPFVALNMAAVPDALFESELFGHVRGAFTGAATARVGALREASGGVLFLDEIGELALHLQAKLLRALELQEFRPLGASADAHVSLFLIAATSRNLWAACEQGSFRWDLLYRLAGATLKVPPLRERREDILPLAYVQLGQLSPELQISADVAERLLLAKWEGNIRQLRYVITHAVCATNLTGRTRIESSDLPDVTVDARAEDSPSDADVLAAFRRAGGVASSAARLLGVSRTTLYARCKRKGIDLAVIRCRLRSEQPKRL
jgi:transcriptional regulator of acetoin/glycerol metabolism